MAVEHYRELEVWQKAMDLAEFCYKATQNFPKNEMFCLVPQIRRSAASVAANIAEGQARGPNKEFLQFLRIAQGSLAELETHLLLCSRVELIRPEQLDSAMALTDGIGRMLRGLHSAVSKKIAGP